MKGAQYKANLDAGHAKALAMQKANTPVPMESSKADMISDKKKGIKEGGKRDIKMDKKIKK